LTDPIESISCRLAVIVANKASSGNVENIRFTLAYFIGFFTVIISSSLIGLLTGRFAETLIAMITFYYFRKYTGGYHFRSLTVCTAVSATLLASIPHIPIDKSAAFILSAGCLPFVLARRSVIKRDKIASVIIVVLCMIVALPSVSLALLSQLITLIPRR